MNKIKNLGIVENIDGAHLKVRIIQNSACSACSVKGHCSVSESKEKIIDVYNANSVPCQIGERVMIAGTTSMGMKAVLLAFVLPFVVLMTVLSVSLQLTQGDEPLSALFALTSLIPYYFIIYCFRKKISRTLPLFWNLLNN